MVFRKSGGEEHFVPKLETRRAVCVIRGLWRSSPGFSIRMNAVTENKKLALFFSTDTCLCIPRWRSSFPIPPKQRRTFARRLCSSSRPYASTEQAFHVRGTWGEVCELTQPSSSPSGVPVHSLKPFISLRLFPEVPRSEMFVAPIMGNRATELHLIVPAAHSPFVPCAEQTCQKASWFCARGTGGGSKLPFVLLSPLSCPVHLCPCP